MPIRLCTLLVAALLVGACRKDHNLSTQIIQDDTLEWEAIVQYLNVPIYHSNEYFDQKIPRFLQTMGLQQPPISAQKAVIGQVLFYDKNLSRDRSVSCASCHKQSKAFSDDVAFSRGIEGRFTNRNSMPLTNVAVFAAHYQQGAGPGPKLFWDNRAANVAEQSRQTFANEHEMGLSMEQVRERIREQPYYPFLWKRAYGDFEVTEAQILECLQSFVGAMGSYKSRFDRALEASGGNMDSIVISAQYQDTIILPFFGLSSNQMRGKNLFVTHCTKCHSLIRPLQEVFEACIGLDEQYSDQGLGAITGRSMDMGVFKAPPLRNVALTAPYMHDGRFNTLVEVLDFYSEGIKNHPNLHPLLRRTDGQPGFNFSPEQKADIIAFLQTLTDNSLVLDERFANPFK